MYQVIGGVGEQVFVCGDVFYGSLVLTLIPACELNHGKINGMPPMVCHHEEKLRVMKCL